jgi:hypothetical protein
MRHMCRGTDKSDRHRVLSNKGAKLGRQPLKLIFRNHRYQSPKATAANFLLSSFAKSRFSWDSKATVTNAKVRFSVPSASTAWAADSAAPLRH